VSLAYQISASINDRQSQISRIDGQLDRLQLAATQSVVSAQSENEIDEDSSKRQNQLLATIKALSTASSARPLLTSYRLLWLLDHADLHVADVSTSSDDDHTLKELEWLLVSKAAVQAYGIILDTFLNQITPLNDDIWYWDDVLSSYSYSGLYMLQTSPLRAWAYGKVVSQDVVERAKSLNLSSLRSADADAEGSPVDHAPNSARWRQYYDLVKQSVRKQWVGNLQSNLLSPITKCRLEARRKQKNLKKLREMSASGLGVLMDEALTFDAGDAESDTSKPGVAEHNSNEWKSIVAKSVSLMETVLQNVTTLETGVHDFEDIVFANVENDPEGLHGHEDGSFSQPNVLADKLKHILTIHLPEHIETSRQLTKEHGKPSRMIRYWLPATALVLSSSTLLRIFFRRRAEIVQWIRELGATTRDFWFNWIVQPVKKVIGTIRHDKDSEIAIMSKESLQGDRSSLERMVVDFAVDNPDTGAALTETEINTVRAKVKEGDLTPVLKAYEKDLKSPFSGAVRGNLVRALLIQVQKTKVDVEVAMSGIDALLKSQELVFGFVGLTPGVLVCLGLGRWFASTFGGRKGRSSGKRKVRMVRVLRNIDRILTACTPSSNGMLSYKEHGLLLCEVHVLRQNGQHVIPSEIYREFLEEINDLVDIRTGVDRQLKVVERIRWAYSKWLY
jgi:nuclear-control-of-ATPase protein 2